MRNARPSSRAPLAALAVLSACAAVLPLGTPEAAAVEEPVPGQPASYEDVVDLTFPTDRRATYYDDFDSPRSRGSHGATDLMGQKGWGVYAAVGGTVTAAPGSDGASMPSYGYMVRIAGVDGRRYSYLHLNNDTPGTDDGKGGPEHAFTKGIVEGAKVVRGQLIGYLGDSGNAEGTAPHLHFEISDPDVVDPGGTNRINPWFSLNDARARGDYPVLAPPLAPTTPARTAPAGTVPADTAPVGRGAAPVDRGAAPGSAFDASGARRADDSCPAGSVRAPEFEDVPEASVHHATVRCAVWWQLTSGTTPQRFEPARDVTREQMATFLARLVVAGGATLPSAPPDAFGDDDGSRHEPNIDRVAAAGIMGGVAEGRFGPSRPVTRGQMARYLVRAYDHAAGRQLPDAPDAFNDDTGQREEPDINRAAAVGFASGIGPGVFAPDRLVTRGQMSSFLARALDLLVEDGVATLP